MTLEQKIKRLKRDYQRNILPSVKRHKHFVGKSELRRAMTRRGIKKGKMEVAHSRD